MCINLQTSLVAFIIGEVSGFLLTQKSEDRKPLGYFVMFFSLVQLCEVFIYYYDNNFSNNFSNIFKKLLLLNLGFQGLVFFILMNQIFIIPNIYFIISGFITIFIIYKALDDNYNKSSIVKDKCLRWKFLQDKSIKYILLFKVVH